VWCSRRPAGGSGRAAKAVNGVLGSLDLLKHPDKTFVGRTERGFDFLGYHFGPEGFTVAAETIEQFVARATRRYEPEPGEACASARVGMYVRRWVRWAAAGLGGDAGTDLLVASRGTATGAGQSSARSGTLPVHPIHLPKICGNRRTTITSPSRAPVPGNPAAAGTCYLE
jgi:hypothetical protein